MTYSSDHLCCVCVSRDFLDLFIYFFIGQMGINGKLLLYYVFMLKTNQTTSWSFTFDTYTNFCHLHKHKIQAKRSYLQSYKCMHLYTDPSTKVKVLLESGSLYAQGAVMVWSAERDRAIPQFLIFSLFGWRLCETNTALVCGVIFLLPSCTMHIGNCLLETPQYLSCEMQVEPKMLKLAFTMSFKKIL